MLKLMMLSHIKYRQKLAIQKDEYEKLKIEEIQNILTRDYHYLKWSLVEMLELQEREVASYGFKKQFSDIVNFLRSQQMDKSMELADPSRKITLQDFQHEVGMMKLQRKVEDITVETAKTYADEPAGPSDYIAMIN